MLVWRYQYGKGGLMDKFSLYAGQFLSFSEHFAPKGHRACQGCGVALAVRHVYKALEGKCTHMDKASWQIPWKHSALAQAEKQGSVVEPALLSIAKEKNQNDTLYICLDNECVEGKIERHALIKRQPAIALANDFKYAATACPSHPFDLFEKVQRAWEAPGNSYIHILSPCPVGWEFPFESTVRLGRIAVETRLFPLYEVAGEFYHITVDEPNPRPVADYIKRQKRFSHWKQAQIDALQADVDAAYQQLKDKAQIVRE
jgi:pyruvate ferredoxin oxidoreductase beta subunit